MKATVEAFSRAYAAASSDAQAALRAWMRNIILPGNLRRSDLDRVRRSEKESVDARMREIAARVDLYMAAKKWEMAAAVAIHLVKFDQKKQAGGSIWLCDAGPPRCISKKIRDGILSFSVLPK